MGKTNKANRTKGNTRPSSSGHSANLLGVSGGFVGFDTFGKKDMPTYVPVTGQQDAADTTVDSDFRMVMRKMLKRDAITRLKAVQEFGDHCVEKDKETVKNVLPFWPRLFNRLALDHDRRVREATHQANGKLLSKVSRDVAPFLKGVMGVWMIGRCDPHAPASSAAQDAFDRTFSPAKQADVLLFCREEIIAYFKDNLFEQTVKSLSEPNTASPEDMENKYNLVMSATLQALKLFVVTVKSGDGVREDVAAVVGNGKFWKYAKSKESQTRGAWYSLMASICRLMPDVFEGTEKKLATTAFSCLSESDPIVAPCIWECALSVAVNLKECWQGVDVNKVLLPQLWSLVQGGGKGNAGSLYPCLLPLLSRLPPDIAQSQAFLHQFYSGLAKSLTLDCVKRSTTECDAILSALFECLQFMGCTRLGEEGPKLMDDVLMHQVIPLLEQTLHSRDSGHLAISRLCPLLGGLLARLEKSLGFVGVLEGFWQRMLPIAHGVFTTMEGWETAVVFLAYFFNSLLETGGRREKKTVRFKDEEETAAQEEPPSTKRSSGVLANKGSISFPKIIEFCAKLCGEIDKEPSRSLGYTRLLEEILTSASNECIVEELAKMCLEDVREGQKPTPRFIEKIVMKWMREAKMDDERLDCLVNITLLSCSFVSLEESREILDACCKLEASTVEHLLKRGLAVCRDAPFFRSWLRSSGCGRKVLGRLEEIFEGKKLLAGDTSKWEVEGCTRVLKLCLLDADTELLIDDETLENLLRVLRNLLTELFAVKGVDEISDIALFIIHDVTVALLKVPKRCWSCNASEELVHQLFNSFLKNALLFELSGQVSQVLFDILGAAIDSYVTTTELLSTDASLIVRMARDLNVFLLSLENQKEASHLRSHCVFLVSAVRKSLAQHESSVAVSRKIIETILLSPETWVSLREGLTVNFLPFFLRKKIFFPLTFDGESFFYPQDRVTRLRLASEVVSGVLCDVGFDFGIGSENVPERDYVVEHVPYLLWCLTFCKGTRKRLDECKESFEKKLERSCLKMLSLLQPSEIDEVIQNIFNLSLQSGEWALCLQNLGEVSVWNLGESRLHRFAEEQFESSSTLAMFEGSEKYMLRQVLIPYLSFEKKLLHFEELLIELNSMDNLDDKNFCGKMAEVCFYFQDGLLLKSLDLQTLLMPIFRTIAPYLQEKGEGRELKGAYHLQIESIVSSAVQRDVSLLNSEVWDFFVEEFLKLIIEGGSECLASPRSLVDFHRVLTIFVTLSKLFLASREEDNSEETLLDWKPPPLPHLFHTHVIQLYIRVSMKEEKAFLPESCCLVLGEMLEAVQYLPGKHIVETLLSPPVSQRLQEVVAFLSSTVRPLQLASHTMLIKMMPLLPELLRDPNPTEEEEGEDEKGEEFERIPPELGHLLNRLRFLDEVVTSMLAEVSVGEGVCTVLPYTDSYSLCMAYLLAWTQVMEFVAAAPSQVRLAYASDLQDKGLLPSLFDNVFRLMPENPLVCLRRGMGVVGTPRKEDVRALFLEPPMLNTGTPSPEEIQCVACHVFAMALRKVPASIRTWWNNLDRKSADIVNNFTSKYVSSHLCAAEIQAVHEHGKKFENLTVQGRPGSREVIATYTIDEASIELCVQLPSNHPLGPISTERRGRVGVGQLEWRQWLLQLNSTLNYQNGSILDGLAMWKRNLDQKFRGVEECMICYYVLHSATLRLPRLSCHVCRKKFHSDCLYKWFHTSNNFTCPLCRNEFRM